MKPWAAKAPSPKVPFEGWNSSGKPGDRCALGQALYIRCGVDLFTSVKNLQQHTTDSCVRMCEKTYEKTGVDVAPAKVAVTTATAAARRTRCRQARREVLKASASRSLLTGAAPSVAASDVLR